MGEKKVSVLITAKDALTNVFKGIARETKSWSEQVTKIAAGIGIADSFKEVGRAIKESIKLAAEAYPKLGAGVKDLAKGFQEFRIQAGAAFLEVLQPAIPMLQSMLNWATKLAKQLPDAFDGARIILAEVGGWFKKLPSLGQEAFGELARIAAGFAGKAGFVLELFGVDGAIDKAGDLDAFGNRLIQEGIKARRAIDAETASQVAKLAGATHDFGPRARTKDEQTEFEKKRDAYLAAHANDTESDIRGHGGPSLAPGSDRELKIRKGAAPGSTPPLAEGAITGLQGGADAALSLHEALRLVKAVTPGVAEGINAINDSLLGSIPGFGAVAKAAQKAIGIVAKVEGTVAIAQGAVKVARSIFPFNPADLASGLSMIREGTRLAALGGGGGGGGRAGGGGSRSSFTPNGFSSSSQEAARGRGELQVHIKADPGTVLSAGSPGFQRLIAQTGQAAAYARLIEIDLTGSSR